MQTGMSNATPVKNGLIPAVVQTMSAWVANDGCDFMKPNVRLVTTNQNRKLET